MEFLELPKIFYKNTRQIPQKEMFLYFVTRVKQVSLIYIDTGTNCYYQIRKDNR